MTPEDETNVFTKLPPELWYNIISISPHSRLCKPLSLVSHTFRNFFQPLLFSSINIYIPARPDNPDFLRCLQFLGAPHILDAIRSCTIQAIGPDFAESELLRHVGIVLILERVVTVKFVSVIFGEREREEVFLRMRKVREVRLEGCSCSMVLAKISRQLCIRRTSGSEGTDSEVPRLYIQRLYSERNWNPRVSMYWLSLTDPDALQHLTITEGHSPDVFPSSSSSSTKPIYRNVQEITTHTFKDWSKFGELITCCPSVTTLRIANVPRTKAPHPWKLPHLKFYSGCPTRNALEAIILPNAIYNNIGHGASVRHIHLTKCSSFQMYDALRTIADSDGHRRGVQSISLKMMDVLTLSNPLEVLKRFEDLRAVEVSVGDAKPEDRRACVTALLNLLKFPSQKLPKTLEFIALQISARLPSDISSLQSTIPSTNPNTPNTTATTTTTNWNGSTHAQSPNLSSPSPSPRLGTSTTAEWAELTDILGRVVWSQTHPYLSRVYVFEWDTRGESMRDAYDVKKGKWLGKSGNYETWEEWVRRAM